jgi:hypothetical protein
MSDAKIRARNDGSGKPYFEIFLGDEMRRLVLRPTKVSFKETWEKLFQFEERKFDPRGDVSGENLRKRPP